MTVPSAAFTRDRATAGYYEQRAAEYDEWYEGQGRFAARDRPGWQDEVDGLVAMLCGLPKARTLDVACGTGFLTRHLRGVVVGLDRSKAMVTLLDGDAKVWLLDWDDALLAPRERDLMFIIGGVLAFAPVTPREQSWFFVGYGTANLDPVRLAYYRCVRALEDLVDWSLQVVDADRYSASERADALSIVRGLLSPTGLARLALSSLRDLGLIRDAGSDHRGDGTGPRPQTS